MALDRIKVAAIVAVLVTHGVTGFFDRPITQREPTVFDLSGAMYRRFCSSRLLSEALLGQVAAQ